MTVDALLVQLGAASPLERDDAAAWLGDMLRAGVLDQETAERVVAALVALAVGERDRVVTEQALYSIGEAFVHRLIPLRVVEPLVDRMPTLDNELAGYVLNTLACTRDLAVRPVLARFAADPDPTVRQHAVEAIAELD